MSFCTEAVGMDRLSSENGYLTSQSKVTFSDDKNSEDDDESEEMDERDGLVSKTDRMADFDDVKHIESNISISTNGTSLADSKANFVIADMTEKEKRRIKIKIIKNLIVVSFAFLLLFTGFQSLSNLQSTLNRDDGLGTGGLSVIYAAMVVACMFIPPMMIRKLGCKWTIAVSMVGYIVYMGANFYAVWGTIIPASVLIGACAAPLWSAKCTYLTETGIQYAKVSEEVKETVISRFFGIFFMLFQTGQIWGNVISSQVFATDPGNVSDTILDECGANYCPQKLVNDNNTNLDRPIPVKVYTLCGIYVGLGVLAFLVISLLLDKLVLDSDSEDNREEKDKGDTFSLRLLIATLRHIARHLNQVLLIPLTIYSGLEQGFIASDFTRSYVGCALGIWWIGYVMICFGVADAVCSYAFGKLAQFIGRQPFFIGASIFQFGVLVALLLWQPVPDQKPVFFVFAGLWGMSDAVWQTQINALYGSIFCNNQEAAFSNYRLWESVGFIVAFAYGEFLCTNIKLYVLIAVLAIGITGYGLVEIREKRHNSSQDLTIST